MVIMYEYTISIAKPLWNLHTFHIFLTVGILTGKFMEFCKINTGGVGLCGNVNDKLNFVEIWRYFCRRGFCTGPANWSLL